MAYFLPSFFQKRILRYALSRLELLDTNDLALDNLDIAWGKRSTVELRDVGLNLQVRAVETEGSTSHPNQAQKSLPARLFKLTTDIPSETSVFNSTPSDSGSAEGSDIIAPTYCTCGSL